jgi:hypothetical protein
VRVEVFNEAFDGFDRPRVGLLELDATLKPHAWVAALEASGRVLIELGIFGAGLASLFGLKVLSILPFFSGEGVRDFFSSDAPTDKVDAFKFCVRLLIRFAVLPELCRGVIEGRVGSGGGLDRSE